MKKQLFTLVVFLFSFLKFSAQGNIQYSIQVIDNSNIPQSNILISAVETSSLETVETKTDDKGVVHLKLNNGKEWSISIGEIKKELTIAAIPLNVIQLGRVYVYDVEGYNRKKLQDNNRSNDGFKVIKQTVNQNSALQPSTSMLILKMRHPNGRRLADLDIHVVNVKDSLIYKSKTDYKGDAVFLLPNNNNYDIDINTVKNYSFSDFGAKSIKRPLIIEYVPTIVNERVINDTIHQTVKSTTEASSERALVKVNVNGGKKGGSNENVYLRELKSGQVYKAITNKNKQASFLVPIGSIYMVDFQYEKDADAVNLSYAKGDTKAELDVSYRPDPRLEYPEKFIPTPDNLLIKKFNSFLEKEYKKSTNSPFLLKMSSIQKMNKHSKEALFKLTLSGSENYGKGIRLPSNVMFVLDKSGSMYAEERTEFLKKSLVEVGGVLTQDDHVSVALFDHDATVVHNTSSNNTDHLNTIAENYQPNGGTNIYKGLTVGTEYILDNFDLDKSNKVILLTDGYGITPPEEITRYVKLNAEKGIEFSTIGIGQYHNQVLLTLIAQHGNGTFNYIDKSPRLKRVLLNEVKNAFNYTAKDLKIDIYHNEELIFSNLYGYPNTNVSKGNVSFEIKKLPKDINQLAFLKFKLTNPSEAIEAKPIVVKVSYFDLVKNKTVTYEENIQLEWTEESDTELQLKHEEKTLYAIAILNQSLKTMADANENNEPKLAKSHLENGIQQIERLFPDAKPKKITVLFEEVNKYIALFKRIEMNK